MYMDTQLKVLSYNILDVELESNFVPRNMDPKSKDEIMNKPTEKDLEGAKNPYDYLMIKYGPYFSGKDGFEVLGGKTESRKLWAENKKKKNTDNNHPNLMFLLDEMFGAVEAKRLYENLEANNYPWISNDVSKKNRLDRVYEKIIGYKADIICLQEYGNCKNLTNAITGGTTFIDNENTNDDTNRQKTTEGSLPDKLQKEGYQYELFSYNPDERNGDDGVAIFYKRDKFDFIKKEYVDMDSIVQSNKYGYITENGKTKLNKYTTQRGCGLLELNMTSNSKKVVICTTHIQTTSNEPYLKKGSEPNGDKYAIRRGELQFIKNHINSKYGSTNDMVIFCGDLNLNLNKAEDKEVIDEFEENNILKRINQQRYKTITTGLSEDEEEEYIFHEPNNNFLTSYPSGRREYIDYFFTNMGGELSGNYIKEGELYNKTIPNGADQPSDHIPILLTIDLETGEQETGESTISGGKTRKMRRNPKRKTQRKKQKKTKRKISKPKGKSKGKSKK